MLACGTRVSRQAAVVSRKPKAAGGLWAVLWMLPLQPRVLQVASVYGVADADSGLWVGVGGSEWCVGGVVRGAACSVASISPSGRRHMISFGPRYCWGCRSGFECRARIALLARRVDRCPCLLAWSFLLVCALGAGSNAAPGRVRAPIWPSHYWSRVR
jgi:hypothetical protein